MCLLRHAESLVAVCRCYLWIYFNDVRGISTRHGSPDLNTQRGSVAEVTMRMQICQCGYIFVSFFFLFRTNQLAMQIVRLQVYIFLSQQVRYVRLRK